MPRTQRRISDNLVDRVEGVDDVTLAVCVGRAEFDPRFTGDDLAWIRRHAHELVCHFTEKRNPSGGFPRSNWVESPRRIA